MRQILPTVSMLRAGGALRALCCAGSCLRVAVLCARCAVLGAACALRCWQARLVGRQRARGGVAPAKLGPAHAVELRPNRSLTCSTLPCHCA